MKDRYGNVLAVGDIVAAAEVAGSSCRLYKAKIVGFTPTMARLLTASDSRATVFDENGYTFLKGSTLLIKVGE